MTALIKDTKIDKLDVDDAVIPRLMSFPVEANTTIYGGAMVGINAAGNAVPASANSALKIVGRCERQVVNTAAAGFGAAGALQVPVRQGVFFYNVGTGADALTAASYGAYCFASDDNTVNLTDAGGTRPIAGPFLGLNTKGYAAVWLGGTVPWSVNPEISTLGQFKARNVVTTNVATPTAAGAYTVASASTNDNVLGVAGDVILLTAQTTPAQNGPYVIGTVTTGTAALSRPDWWPSGGTAQFGATIEVGPDGTLFKNTTWKATAKGAVIDTTDPALYPRVVTQSVTLVAGTATISNVPILSATKTGFAITRTTANTSTATTGGYAVVGTITPGPVGTASAVVDATVAAGTINNADVSTLAVTIVNQV